MAINRYTPINDFTKSKLQKKQNAIPVFLYLVLISSVWMLLNRPTQVFAQEPTPTMTLPQPQGTGMFITVTTTTEDHVNVRGGPSSAIYPVIGTLPVGATAPATGRSPGGDWVQIEFPQGDGNIGWVYVGYITVSNGVLPIVDPPPTPLPPPAPTIDPTLAAQFNSVPTTTRLPTFTPGPALAVPVFTPALSSSIRLPIAPGIAILVLGIAGTLGLLFSLVNRN